MIGLEDWKSIQETIYLESTGTMDKVKEKEKKIIVVQQI